MVANTDNEVRGAAEAINGTLIRIDPREVQIPGGQIGLPLGAAEGIQRICDLANGLAGSSGSRV